MFERREISREPSQLESTFVPSGKSQPVDKEALLAKVRRLQETLVGSPLPPERLARALRHWEEDKAYVGADIAKEVEKSERGVAAYSTPKALKRLEEMERPMATPGTLDEKQISGTLISNKTGIIPPVFLEERVEGEETILHVVAI